jgi:hypothetical protein
MLEWVNANSNGSVEVKVVEITHTFPDTIYIGFENPDDATFFKIKYAL